jgi:hypothetical protein
MHSDTSALGWLPERNLDQIVCHAACRPIVVVFERLAACLQMMPYQAYS